MIDAFKSRQNPQIDARGHENDAVGASSCKIVMQFKSNWNQLQQSSETQFQHHHSHSISHLHQLETFQRVHCCVVVYCYVNLVAQRWAKKAKNQPQLSSLK